MLSGRCQAKQFGNQLFDGRDVTPSRGNFARSLFAAANLIRLADIGPNLPYCSPTSDDVVKSFIGLLLQYLSPIPAVYSSSVIAIILSESTSQRNPARSSLRTSSIMAPQLAWIGLGNMGRVSFTEFCASMSYLTCEGHV